MRTLFTPLLSWVLVFSMALSPAVAVASSKLPDSNSAIPQRQLQRLFGRQIKTINGEFSVRQIVGASGRPYKQMIVGPRFSEMQIDPDQDGRVDIWEIETSLVRVTFSNPARGQFALMSVVDRNDSRGVITASYVLSADGMSYLHDQSVFKPAGTAAYSETRRAAEPNPLSDFEPIDVDVDADAKFQMERLTSPYQCLDLANDPVARAQREWWKFLRDQGKLSRDDLAGKLRDSMMFDANCRQPKFASDFNALTRGIADIMMTSSTGLMGSERSDRGKFLQCLEASKLDLTAARIEKKFVRAIMVPGPLQDPPAVTCNWDPAGGNVKASYVEKDASGNYLDQIDLRMCLRHEGSGLYPYGAPVSYQNLLFHELLHSAGFAAEEDVDKIVGCCGDRIGDRDGDRTKACEEVDAMASGMRRVARLESRLGRNKTAIDPLIYKMEAAFNSRTAPLGASKVYKAYLERLATEVDFDACLGFNGDEQANCRVDQYEKISELTEKFFNKRCVGLVEKMQAANCRAYEKNVGLDLARAVTEGLYGKLGCRSSSALLFKRNFFALLFFGSNAVAAEACDLSDAPGRDSEARGAATGDRPPQLDAPQLRTIVPSPVEGERIGSGGLAVGSQPAPIVLPERGSASPLPISRIDSEPRPARYVEDRYRQATDIAGRAMAGLSKLRKAILPEAGASEGGSGVQTEFVVFRPGQARGPSATVETPFKNWRGLASVAASAATAAMPAAPKVNSAAGMPAADKLAISAGARASHKSASDPAPLSSVRAPSASGAASTARLSAPSVGEKRRAASSVSFEDLFRRPYREIEFRFVEVDVIERLIQQNISIKDAKGQLHGSSRALKKYKFVRQDRPLAEAP